MFQTILIGYDEPERGAEATALAETLRNPSTAALIPTTVHPPDAAARVLAEVAEAEQADLVVVGSSRRGARGRLLPGVTAERLLHDAPCPVAVAPRGYSGGDIRRIGVAYDGSPEADAALRAAQSFARERCAALTVYCVVEAPARAASEPARALLEGAGDDAPPRIRPEWLVFHGVPAEEIPSRAYGAVDLLFVGAGGHRPLRHALLGNVSGALVRAAGCPVVVTPRIGIAARRAQAVAAQEAVSAA